MSDVDSKLVTLFNQASTAGRAGLHEEAVQRYTEVVRKAREGKLEASDEFVATAWMQCGFSLMDLSRWTEAEAAFFAAKKLQGSLSSSSRFELHFALGNTLGNLGRVRESFSALIEAVSWAEEMDDYVVRPLRCWKFILEHAERAKDWAFVLEKAEIALNVGRVRGIVPLQVLAVESLKRARASGGASANA